MHSKTRGLVRTIRQFILTISVLPLALACSPAAEQRITQLSNTAHAVCVSAMAAEPLIEIAARRVGKPLDEYVAEACAVEMVVSPLVRAANDLAVCPSYPWPTAGAAGAPQ
jgi:hypothetical protein